MVEPIALEARIGSVCGPDGVAPVRTVIMTLGLFSVVELFRPVTILVPTYEYTIPAKECHADTESPCAVFDKIRFPAEEFTPATLSGSARANPAIAERPYSRTRTVHRKRRKRCFGSMSTLENGRQNCRPFDVSGRSYV